MVCYIDNIFYSPVKSISFIDINSVKISKNRGIENDRIFSFTRIIDFDLASLINNDPIQRKLQFFLTLKNTPSLNKYNFLLVDNYLIFKRYDSVKEIMRIETNNINDYKKISEKLIELETNIKKPIYLLKNTKNPFFDTTPKNTISLININTVKEFSDRIKQNIQTSRFRGNIYVNDLKPWEEFTWVGKTIEINNVIFKVTDKIPRCSATNLQPGTNNVTLNLPLTLRKFYNHNFMGVFITPEKDGFISKNNAINVL